MNRFLFFSLLAPSLAWAEPGSPMPDDLRRAEEAREVEIFAHYLIRDGRCLISWQQFNGPGTITIAEVWDDEGVSRLCDHAGLVVCYLKPGQWVYRESRGGVHAVMLDPSGLQRRLREIRNGIKDMIHQVP